MIRAKLIVSFVFLMLGVFISQATHAAKMSSSVINFQGEQIRFVKIKGEIIEGDDLRLNNIIEKYEDTDAPVILVALNSIGGDIDESHEMVETIINYDISTTVLPNDECFSACFAVYAAGSGRYLYPESRVGVHRGVVEGDDFGFETKVAILEMEEMYKQLDVPAGIIKKMKNTPPTKLYYLNQKEMRAMSTEKSQFGVTAAGNW